MDFKNGKFNFICVGQERDDRRQSSLTIISIKSFFCVWWGCAKVSTAFRAVQQEEVILQTCIFNCFMSKKGKKNSQLGILVQSEALQKVVPG